jgi:hypothetical protein
LNKKLVFEISLIVLRANGNPNILCAIIINFTMGTGSFLGVKWPGRDADHPPPSSAEVENEES